MVHPGRFSGLRELVKNLHLLSILKKIVFEKSYFAKGIIINKTIDLMKVQPSILSLIENTL